MQARHACRTGVDAAGVERTAVFVFDEVTQKKVKFPFEHRLQSGCRSSAEEGSGEPAAGGMGGMDY